MSTSYHLRELYNLVKGDEFVWSDVKHKCLKGIRYFSERQYIKKVRTQPYGVHVWKIRKAYVEKLSAVR